MSGAQRGQRGGERRGGRDDRRGGQGADKTAYIERVVAIGGAYYLPYRLHARRDQMARAYPDLDTIVAAKRRYDPGLLFRNALWSTYMA